MDDLISRQAAIEAVRNMWGIVSPISDDILLIDKAQAETELMMLPTAEPRKGRWEYNDYGGFGNWHCTACGEICICNGGENYCPNCGARMEEE